MKTRIHHILAKTPLLFRVVSLYAVIGVLAGYFLAPQVPLQAASENTVAIQTSPQPPVNAKPQLVSGRPVRLELPRIGLTRDIIAGKYDTSTRQWTLTDDKAQYATMTSPANNQSGQTLIYGHNTAAVLEPVRDVRPKDKLLITTANGKVLVYTYSHDRFVKPTDTSVVYEKTATPRVVLMTCEGILSEERRLLYFDFKGAQ